MKINLPKYKKDTPKDKFIAEFKSIPIEDCLNSFKSVIQEPTKQKHIYNDKSFAKKHNRLFRFNNASSSQTTPASSKSSFDSVSLSFQEPPESSVSSESSESSFD